MKVVSLNSRLESYKEEEEDLRVGELGGWAGLLRVHLGRFLMGEVPLYYRRT